LDDAVALLATWFLLTLAAIGSASGCGPRILVALVCCFPIPFALPILACALGCGG
jgi:hypothetical protein